MERAYLAILELRVRTLMLYGICDQIISSRTVFKAMGTLVMHAENRAVVYSCGWYLPLRDLNVRIVLHYIMTWVKNRDSSLSANAATYSFSPTPIEWYY